MQTFHNLIIIKINILLFEDDVAVVVVMDLVAFLNFSLYIENNTE